MALFIRFFLLVFLYLVPCFAGHGFNITDYELGAVHIPNDFAPPETIDLEDFVSSPGLGNVFCYFAAEEEIPKDIPSTPFIINQAVTGLQKSYRDRTDVENICLGAIQFSIKKLAANLIPYFQKHEKTRQRLVIFGGVALGSGPLYQQLLQKEIDVRLREINSQMMVDVWTSPLGDERAIIGSVAYASSLEDTKPYAIGVDLGGTHIRAGKVNLESLAIEGSIGTCSTLSCRKNFQDMRRLSNNVSSEFQRNSIC